MSINDHSEWHEKSPRTRQQSEPLFIFSTFCLWIMDWKWELRFSLRRPFIIAFAFFSAVVSGLSLFGLTCLVAITKWLLESSYDLISISDYNVERKTCHGSLTRFNCSTSFTFSAEIYDFSAVEVSSSNLLRYREMFFEKLLQWALHSPKKPRNSFLPRNLKFSERQKSRFENVAKLCVSLHFLEIVSTRRTLLKDEWCLRDFCLWMYKWNARISGVPREKVFRKIRLIGANKSRLAITLLVKIIFYNFKNYYDVTYCERWMCVHALGSVLMLHTALGMGEGVGFCEIYRGSIVWDKEIPGKVLDGWGGGVKFRLSALSNMRTLPYCIISNRICSACLGGAEPLHRHCLIMMSSLRDE